MDGQQQAKPSKAAVSDSFRHKHHHKPYLLRHLGLLIVASWLIFASLFGLFINHMMTGPTKGVLAKQTGSAQGQISLFTSGGVGFQYDTELLKITSKLDPIKIVPSYGKTRQLDAATQLTIQLHGNGPKPADNTPGTTTKIISQTPETLGGVAMQKTTYQYATKLGSDEYLTYKIEWSGSFNGQTLVIALEGLQNPKVIPAAFATVLDTLSFGAKNNVLGANTQTKIPESYAVEAVSPAVVKIYRINCGILMIDGKEAGKNACDAAVGSGFFVSSDGHIATSGHVVEYEAEDALVSVLTKDPGSLADFLRYSGLTDKQVQTVGQRPDLQAAIIAKVYDTPKGTISFKDKKSALIVGLGSRPLALASEEDARNALELKDTDYIKRAEILASNYNAKDILVIQSGDKEGFSSSDVALLKVNALNTPFIQIFKGLVTQNQKITILGFPQDADNQLTNNNSLSPTATNGSISAIRSAAGSSYKLYQSDADASQGNSGGPVVTEDGQVLGILTYRYKDAAAVDAAKSYIRDINDLEKLALDKGITLNASGSTQAHWLNGLKFFSQSRFSKAQTEFEQVVALYPGHRLAPSYQKAAETAVADGQDIPEIPPAVIISASFIGAVGAAGAIILIARHHAAHLAYKTASATYLFRPHHARS